MRRIRLSLAATIAAALLLPATSQADSATMAFLDAAGKSDPVVDVGRTWRLSGTASSQTRVWFKFRATGGAPCAPSYQSDTGDPTSSGSWGGDRFNETQVNGNFRLEKTGRWDDAGTFMFCIWLADTASESVTPITQNITFRKPSATVSGTVDPATPMVGQTTTLSITGVSEAPKRVFAKIRDDGGAPCAVSYSADTGDRIVRDHAVDGAFTVTPTFTPSTAGAKLICLWVSDGDDDGAPVAGPQPVTFNVVQPCVVPEIEPGTAIAAAQSALVAAACALGPVTLAASTEYVRGTVISVAHAEGTTLPPGTAVPVTVSDGPPCVVPSVSGLKVAAARKRIHRAGCTIGRIVLKKSFRRRGRVIGIRPRSGTQLAPRAPVTISVSRGRR